MRYRIEYSGNRKSTIADGRTDLLKKLKTSAGVIDIRKVYGNGISDSVMEKYKDYIPRGCHGMKNT